MVHLKYLTVIGGRNLRQKKIFNRLVKDFLIISNLDN